MTSRSPMTSPSSTSDVGALTGRHRRAGEDSGARDVCARAQIAAAVAAQHAGDVDRDGRFPHEALDALRAQRLLGLMIPAGLGGEGGRAADVVDVCYILGAACASSAMIFAMHQVKIACLTRHANGDAWQERLQRRIAGEQLLMASSTTEGSAGGAIRSSEAAVQRNGSRIALERNASVISYGEHSDGVVTTARRSEASAHNDQVLVAFLKEDYTLERTGGWNALGMRGTCSAGFILRAQGEAAQILPEPYERIHAQTMVPAAHLFWSACWAGIAAGAVQRARAFVRKAARASGGQMPPAAAHLTRARLQLETLRGAIQSGVRTYEAHSGDPGGLGAGDVQLAMTFLKVEASELAVAVVLSAMRACGLAGYRNDGEFTMGRYLRDVLSAPIMINNDRILANAEAAVLTSDPPIGLGHP
jgi:acyl-CoA dehydrogenase